MNFNKIVELFALDLVRSVKSATKENAENRCYVPTLINTPGRFLIRSHGERRVYILCIIQAPCVSISDGHQLKLD